MQSSFAGFLSGMILSALALVGVAVLGNLANRPEITETVSEGPLSVDPVSEEPLSEYSASEEPASEEPASGGGTSENAVAGTAVSGNIASENKVSEDTVSEDMVSGQDDVAVSAEPPADTVADEVAQSAAIPIPDASADAASDAAKTEADSAGLINQAVAQISQSGAKSPVESRTDPGSSQTSETAAQGTTPAADPLPERSASVSEGAEAEDAAARDVVLDADPVQSVTKSDALATNDGSSLGLQPPVAVAEPEDSTTLTLAGEVPREEMTAQNTPSDAPSMLEPEAQVPEPSAPSIVALSEPSPARSVAATAGTIGDLAQGVRTNRLPAIGDPDPTEANSGEGDSGSDTSAGDLPPLERYAITFENETDRPLVAIILVDDGAVLQGPEALSDLPHPVSVALDVTHADAAMHAARYRRAGHEILALTNLPPATDARETEVVMASYLTAIPQAVAVLEGGESGLQLSREVSKQMGDILLESGHGVVLRPNGLNTAQKLIAQKGVPSMTSFLDLDANQEDERGIRRHLDQAVFRAGQSGGNVVVLGRLRAQTIDALMAWSRQSRADSVVLAPVSAVLLDLASDPLNGG